MCFAKLLLAENNMTQEEILKQLSLKPYYNKDFFQYLARFGSAEIANSIALLVEAEYKIKTGQGTPVYIISDLWIKLCNKSASKN
jgi:DNA polymerase III delta subunit